jgi:hypothetical protein
MDISVPIMTRKERISARNDPAHMHMYIGNFMNIHVYLKMKICVCIHTYNNPQGEDVSQE